MGWLCYSSCHYLPLHSHSDSPRVLNYLLKCTMSCSDLLLLAASVAQACGQQKIFNDTMDMVSSNFQNMSELLTSQNASFRPKFVLVCPTRKLLV